MKVFVYSKYKSKRQMIIKEVYKVEEKPEEHKILFHSKEMGIIECDTRYVKTSSFQN